MPPAIEASIKAKVIQQWLSGDSRSKIAIDNDIGEGTISSIINNFKIGLDNSEFDSARELALAAKKQGLTPGDLASHTRLYNYFRSSGAAEEEVESFIDNVSTNDVSPEKVIQYVNQLHEISKAESIPLHEVPTYIEKKLEEKKKIDEDIQEAETILQSKNVSIEAINEHIQLNEKLNEYGLSMHNIDELLNLVSNAKKYGFEPKIIVGKLRTIERLEKKEKGLKNNCTILANLLDRHKETVPLAELIEAMHVGKNELISFKIAANEAAELYGFPRSTAAVYILNNLKDYNKKGQLKKELSSLHLQKYAVEEFCSKRSQVIMALMNLKSHGITEEQIISLNSVLESNGYKTSSYTSTK